MKQTVATVQVNIEDFSQLIHALQRAAAYQIPCHSHCTTTFHLPFTGILVGMPDSFYRRKVQETLGVTLGPQDSYGSGIVFTPKSDVGVAAIKEIFESQAKQRGLKVIGWRPIETGTIAHCFTNHAPEADTAAIQLSSQ